MVTVGYLNRTRYWQIYAFNNPPDGYGYKRALDVPFHLLRTNNQFLLNTKWILPFQGIDLYHTYNSIVPINMPWVVEVESLIPRYGQLKKGNQRFNWGVGKLKSDNCKAIIFTSKYTREMNRVNFEKWGIDQKKCHVVYRAVETYDPIMRVDKEKKFTILFVGNAFYRKGGLELLKAFKEISSKDFRLIIVSAFEVDWKFFPTDDDKDFVFKSIQGDTRIKVLKGITHDHVIKLMRKADVYVSTTFSDPFNNTVLEAMACKLPVIVSDERAIPEFVTDGYNGFTCKSDIKNREAVIDHIYNSIKKYYHTTSLVDKHGENGRKIIDTRFSIKQRKNKLKKLYDSIL